MRTKIILLFAVSSLLAFSSCRKEKETPLDMDYTSASDNSKAENVFNDMLLQVDNAVDANGLRDLCAPIVTFDTSATPRTITVDFGDVNCTATNGRIRRGRILVSYTGLYREHRTTTT